jgi:hypothetical protein
MRDGATRKDGNYMEFRWVIFLVLWTLLIGPVLDFTIATSSPPPRVKQAQTSKLLR